MFELGIVEQTKSKMIIAAENEQKAIDILRDHTDGNVSLDYIHELKGDKKLNWVFNWLSIQDFYMNTGLELEILKTIYEDDFELDKVKIRDYLTEQKEKLPQIYADNPQLISRVANLVSDNLFPTELLDDYHFVCVKGIYPYFLKLLDKFKEGIEMYDNPDIISLKS